MVCWGLSGTLTSNKESDIMLPITFTQTFCGYVGAKHNRYSTENSQYGLQGMCINGKGIVRIELSTIRSIDYCWGNPAYFIVIGQ